MKKLTKLVALLCVINVLMLVGLVGFLWGTGRLDKTKVQVIGDLLRQPGSPEGLRVKLYDLMTPTTQTRPATASASAPAISLAQIDVTGPATALERIDYVKRILEEERLRLEAEAQNLLHERNSLVEKERQLQDLKNKLDQQQKAYQQTLAAASTQADTSGFQKTMALFDALKPKQVKDLLLVMPPQEMARYLSAMEPDRAAKIIAEFKTTDELKLLHGVLEKVRGVSGTGAASDATASTPVSAAAGKAGP